MRLRKYLGTALLTVGLLALLSGCDFGNQQHTHTFTKWEVTKDPTCVDEGVQSRDCRECGYVETARIAPVGHTTAKTAAVKATCITDGLTEGTHCSVCDEVLQAQQSIPAFGHSPLKDYAVEPTCTTDGLTEGSHCGLCGAVIVEQTVLPATGHLYEKVTIVTPADCMHMGVKQFTCNWCDASYKDTYTTTEHTIVTDEAVAPTCTKTGLSQGSHCSVCKLVFTEPTIIPELGHSEVQDAAREPNCTDVGLTAGSHCSRCNIVMTPQQEIPALGHQNIEEILQQATCQILGTKKLTCTVCGAESQESFELPHVNDTDIYISAVQYVGEIVTYDRNGNAVGGGIGFVLTEDGRILTNYHALTGSFSAKITINNLTYDIVSVLAYSEKLDLAVVQVEANGLTAAKICAEPVVEGDIIYALGAARGLTDTYAKGVILTAVKEVDGVVYVHHDAAITAANSGGPLMNIYGEIIGIHTLAASDAQGISLSVFASQWNNLEYGEPLSMEAFYAMTTTPYQKLQDLIQSTGKADGLGDVVIYDYVSDSNGLTIYSLGYEPSTQRVYIEVTVSKDGNDTVARVYLTGDPAALQYHCQFSIDRKVYNTVTGTINATAYTALSELVFETFQGMEGNEALVISMYQPKINRALSWLDSYLQSKAGITLADIGFAAFGL